MSERVRYSDEELEEFRVIINEKLELAKRDYEKIMRAIRNEDENGVIDAESTYKGLEDCAAAASLEE